MNKIRSNYRRVSVIAAATLSLSAAALATPQYNITALDNPTGEHRLSANAINDSGVVTGYGFAGETSMAFVWQDGQLRGLGILPDAPYSGGYAINNYGVIAGISGNDSFTWQNGSVQVLPRPEGVSYAYAQSINDAGVVVGYAESRPYIWSGNQTSWLPSLSGAQSTIALGINNKGTIVGYATANGVNQVPLAWLSDGVHILDTGSYQYGFAKGVNNADSAAGMIEDPGVGTQAARWDGGHLTLLNQLPGLKDARAYAISDNGQVVGASFAFGGANGFATLWDGTQSYALQDQLVNGEGWQLYQALDINASGQIVGWGMLNGQPQSFLLTPVPEASSLSCMTLGLMALLGITRRRVRRA